VTYPRCSNKEVKENTPSCAVTGAELFGGPGKAASGLWKILSSVAFISAATVAPNERWPDEEGHPCPAAARRDDHRGQREGDIRRRPHQRVGEEQPQVEVARAGVVHVRITLTPDVYSHVLPTMQEAASQKMEGILFG